MSWSAHTPTIQQWAPQATGGATSATASRLSGLTGAGLEGGDGWPGRRAWTPPASPGPRLAGRGKRVRGGDPVGGRNPTRSRAAGKTLQPRTPSHRLGPTTGQAGFGFFIQQPQRRT
ncbi:unnamed protein product [Amoebophrya sp. A120]|nr:unnamed protein product [Amoebophrya sp. A120]|eukprot:GSA120T00014683001.1